MKQKIYNYSLIVGLFVTIITLIIETLICLKFSYKYSLTFNIGLFTGLFNFFLNDKSLERLEFNNVSKPKIFYMIVNVLKFIIYGVVLFFSTKFFGLYTSFTCAFGMLINKIVIYFITLIKTPINDKKMTVDKLNLSKEIIEKLKVNNFVKVLDLTAVSRKDLQKFLTNNEVNLVIESLREQELFIKGELEAIIEDENVNVKRFLR